MVWFEPTRAVEDPQSVLDALRSCDQCCRELGIATRDPAQETAFRTSLVKSTLAKHEVYAGTCGQLLPPPPCRVRSPGSDLGDYEPKHLPQSIVKPQPKIDEASQAR